MTFTRPLCALLAILALAPSPHAEPPSGERMALQDSLPQRHRPEQGALALDVGRLRSLRIGPEFTHLGGQRFILGGRADAEQHLFVVADSSRIVRRMYWVQIEEMLPTQPGGYDYDSDSAITVAGLSLRANVRRYDAPPTPGSDRARAFAFVESRGYRVPEGATRVRLIYLPKPRARQEVMVIYIEAPAGGVTDRKAAVKRALAGLIYRVRK